MTEESEPKPTDAETTEAADKEPAESEATAAGDPPAPEDAPAETAADPKPEPAEAKAETPEDAAPDDAATRKLVETIQAENADLKDRLLRAAAEMENMRRRFERELADARLYAVTGFAREVLSIGDNLNRAIAAVPEEARKEEGAFKTLLEGVELTDRELLRVLNKHGVVKLEPEGKKFDPNMHQAMFEVEHDEAPHGTVVQVMQAGYSIGDRVLRPAMVGIAKKPAKPKSSEQPAAEAKAAESESAKTEANAEEAAGGPKAANDG
jgi:molecular chaperone GrpE